MKHKGILYQFTHILYYIGLTCWLVVPSTNIHDFVFKPVSLLSTFAVFIIVPMPAWFYMISTSFVAVQFKLYNCEYVYRKVILICNYSSLKCNIKSY